MRELMQIRSRFCDRSHKILLSFAFFFIGSSLLNAQYGSTNAQYQGFVNKKGVGIDQKLNSSIPLDLIFQNELDQAVPLRTYFGEKPVVLALVYYNCPGLCGLTLNDLVRSLKRVDLEPARDYNVVIVSIDPAKKGLSPRARKLNTRSCLLGLHSMPAGTF